MFVFFLIISLLSLVASLFVAVPLLSKKTHCRVSQDPMTDMQLKPYFLSAILLSLSLPIVTIGLYLHWGSSHEIFQGLKMKERVKTMKQEMATFESRQKIIHSLQERLEQLPENKNNAKGWYILGKLYFNENHKFEALFSFSKAVQLNPGEPEYQLQLISLKFLIYRRLDSDDERILTKMLKSAPDNINIINLLALNDYQNKRYAQAIHHWENLLKYFQPDSQDAKMLLNMIHQAQVYSINN